MKYNIGDSIGWPKIPEIPVNFKPCDSGGFKAKILVDLGILGEWEIGEFRIDEPDPVAKKREKEEIVAEVQVAFNRLLMRIAAMALIKRDGGCFPVIGWYANALVEEYGEEKANEMLDGQLTELFKFREDGIGLHEM